MAEAEIIEKSIERLVKKFRVNLFNTETNQGVLRRGVNEYQDCFKADLSSLRKLINKDKVEWTSNPEQVRKLAEEKQKKLFGTIKSKQESIE